MTDYPIIFSAPMVRALLEGRKTQTRRLADVFGRSPWISVRAGARLWVRENFYNLITEVAYAADGKAPGRITPSIHMPRKVSRITLTVTDTKIEMLKQISEADAMAEGAEPILVPPDGGGAPHVEGFADLWRSLHGEASWDENPLVVALTFTVEKRNIDA